MDGLEFSKYLGSFCVAMLAILALANVANAIYTPGGHGDGHAAVTFAEAGHDAAGGHEAGVELSMTDLLAMGDAAKGEKVWGKCKSCHTYEKGGRNGTGPNLYGVMGRDIAAVGGFGYSGVLADMGGAWGWGEMNAFLAKPKGFAPGTKMSFGGLKKDSDRASLMLWLNGQSDNPLALP